MKRMGKIIAALMLLGMLAMACNQYVCPAYQSDATEEQAEADRG